MKNQKAMSEIVTTIIMVVLALVAVAVIWQIISSLISERGTQITITEKCLKVSLAVESVTGCTAATCDIKISRTAGGEAFVGLHVVYKNVTSSSLVANYAGNIPELTTLTISPTLDAADTFDPLTATSVEITPYFKDSSGQNQNCPSKIEYTI